MRTIGQRLLKGMRICKYCGRRILLQGYDSDNRLTRIMEKNTLCYECTFWMDIINFPPDHLEVINNQCLKIYPVADKKDRTLILGGKGKMRNFMRLDGEIFQSNDIWVIGTIPARFSHQLQPTAFEITARAYRQLKQNKKKCKARACLDRYHCFRYDRNLEKDSKPYNSIPPKWKIGDEHCGFFININDIRIDESSITQ